MKIALVGCGKSKRSEPCEARDMYTSPLFQKRRAYAEANFDAWFILSALHGTLDPYEVIAPYDREMKFWAKDVIYWAMSTRNFLYIAVQKLLGLEAIHDIRIMEGVELEIHAGADYANPLLPLFEADSVAATWPVKGLGIGEQLQWYTAPQLTLPTEEVA